MVEVVGRSLLATTFGHDFTRRSTLTINFGLKNICFVSFRPLLFLFVLEFITILHGYEPGNQPQATLAPPTHHRVGNHGGS